MVHISPLGKAKKRVKTTASQSYGVLVDRLHTGETTRPKTLSASQKLALKKVLSDRKDGMSLTDASYNNLESFLKEDLPATSHTTITEQYLVEDYVAAKKAVADFNISLHGFLLLLGCGMITVYAIGNLFCRLDSIQDLHEKNDNFVHKMEGNEYLYFTLTMLVSALISNGLYALPTPQSIAYYPAVIYRNLIAIFNNISEKLGFNYLIPLPDVKRRRTQSSIKNTVISVILALAISTSIGYTQYKTCLHLFSKTFKPSFLPILFGVNALFVEAPNYFQAIKAISSSTHREKLLRQRPVSLCYMLPLYALLIIPAIFGILLTVMSPVALYLRGLEGAINPWKMTSLITLGTVSFFAGAPLSIEAGVKASHRLAAIISNICCSPSPNAYANLECPQKTLSPEALSLLDELQQPEVTITNNLIANGLLLSFLAGNGLSNVLFNLDMGDELPLNYNFILFCLLGTMISAMMICGGYLQSSERSLEEKQTDVANVSSMLAELGVFESGANEVKETAGKNSQTHQKIAASSSGSSEFAEAHRHIS